MYIQISPNGDSFYKAHEFRLFLNRDDASDLKLMTPDSSFHGYSYHGNWMTTSFDNFMWLRLFVEKEKYHNYKTAVMDHDKTFALLNCRSSDEVLNLLSCAMIESNFNYFSNIVKYSFNENIIQNG